MAKQIQSIILSCLLLTMTSCGMKTVPNFEDEITASTVTAVSADKTVTTELTTSTNSKTTAKSTTSTTTSSTTSQTTTTTTTTAAQATPAPTTAPPATAATTASSSSETTPETTTAASAEPVSTTTAESGINADWRLSIANKTHTIGDYVPPEFVTLYNGQQVDSRMYPDLQDMYNAMYAIGLSPYTREAYRTEADQQSAMDTQISYYVSLGYSHDDAVELAEKYVAAPGKSEHQLGLAVDINAGDGNDSGLYTWLSNHAYEYGFILRYPYGKESITGYEYEPWHYRYVGKEAASYIYWYGLTLEEYLSLI